MLLQPDGNDDGEEEQQRRLCRRRHHHHHQRAVVRAIESRPSYRAARELVSNLRHYGELPDRLARFCRYLDEDPDSYDPSTTVVTVVSDGEGDNEDDDNSAAGGGDGGGDSIRARFPLLLDSRGRGFSPSHNFLLKVVVDDDDENLLLLGGGDNDDHDEHEQQALQRRQALTAAVLAVAPAHFFECVSRLFEDWIARGVRIASPSAEEDGGSNNDDRWLRLSQSLDALRWLAPRTGLLWPCWESALERTVLRHVRNLVSDDYSRPFYPELASWKDAAEEWIAAWVMDSAVATTAMKDPSNDLNESDGPVKERTGHDFRSLETILDECYCRVRMDEIFDVVTEYPDSHPAVVELRDVLARTGWHARLAAELQRNLVKRLMHPGAKTSQIIDVYIAVIKVLSVLDPATTSSMALAVASSLLSPSSSAAAAGTAPHRLHQHPSSHYLRALPLLSIVAEPVRRYLRSRTDTVRCIISSLTDAASGGDLYRELKRQDAKDLENVVVDSDDEEECPDMTWQPPPSIWSSRLCLEVKGRASRRTMLSKSGQAEAPAAAPNKADSDILAMLVSIYGSKELFVDEYRIMLADKLLALSRDYNTDQAVHTLELLKIRFGDSCMRNCEVMIKDMDDSKRTNANIHSTLRNAASVVDVAMISHVFWPPLQHEPLKHHPRLQARLDVFSGEYARLKNPRKLIWLEQLGTVDLELECIESTGHRVTRAFTCSPLLATVISHFEDKTVWSLEALSNETSVPSHVLQKKITYWVNQRVLLQTMVPGGIVMYELASADHIEDSSNGTTFHPYASAALGGGSGQTLHVLDEEDDGLNAVSASAQEKAEMEVYESYIVGMLTNAHGGLQLMRIHAMLQTFVSGTDIKYNKTPSQLLAFLQLLCQQEKLECGPDGMYKLFKRHR
jgi:anaphase-promoting complex subunit 2